MRLTPSDAPDFVAFDPDLAQAAEVALGQRPELKQVEQEIRAAELNILKAKDRIKPDVRVLGRYGINGLGEDLGNGIRTLTTEPHHEWELGIRAEFPIGFRGGYAEEKRAELQRLQVLTFFQDQREKLLFSLQRSYQELIQNREQYLVRIQQREASALQLKVRYEKFKAGGDPKQVGTGVIDLLLRAQRNWADALREEYVALCAYRTSIADFERQRGTILQYANVFIDDGRLARGNPAPASKSIRHWHQHLRNTLPPLAKHDSLPAAVEETFPLPRLPDLNAKDSATPGALPASLTEPARTAGPAIRPTLGAPTVGAPEEPRRK
jgi:hypothetical protein